MSKENPHISPEKYPDDLLLWRQIKNGDKAGMEGLYVRYTQQLFRLGMSIKANRSFIKDCIHDVFLNIWKYRHSLKDTDNVKLYLFKCLSHKIQKEIGKDKKRFGQESPDLYETLLYADAIGSDQAFDQVDEGKRLRLLRALESLPTRQHEVIQLLFFESQSYEETSKIMGINVQSVYTLAWKAISNLRKSLISLFVFLLWM
jgi:RNA polymerase sigma factor (sigma-70 family)